MINPILRWLELLTIFSYLTSKELCRARALSRAHLSAIKTSYIIREARVWYINSFDSDGCWLCSYTTAQLRCVSSAYEFIEIQLDAFIKRDCPYHNIHSQLRMFWLGLPECLKGRVTLKVTCCNTTYSSW